MDGRSRGADSTVRGLSKRRWKGGTMGRRRTRRRGREADKEERDREGGEAVSQIVYTDMQKMIES